MSGRFGLPGFSEQSVTLKSVRKSVGSFSRFTGGALQPFIKGYAVLAPISFRRHRNSPMVGLEKNAT
jgi:hypothetical protein